MSESQNQQNRIHARIEGAVQGVGFRAFVEHYAASLGLKGWVRNLWDGSVETVAEGDPRTLERFLEALKRGPRSAHVTHVEVEWEQATGEFSSFTVRRTD
jgi:acylphosphatase